MRGSMWWGLAFVVSLILGGCSEHLPSNPAGGDWNGPPSPYDGPLTGAALAVTDGLAATVGYEWVGDTFISDGTTVWSAARFDSLPFTVATYAGHWYNAMLVRDGQPVLGGYSFAGTVPHQCWTDENQGIFFTHMVLNDSTGAWIWQHPSNLDSLVQQDIKVLNWTGHERLGVVGTITSFSSMPAELTKDEDGLEYELSMLGLPGDYKLAVVDMATGVGLDDSVTVKVNGVELNSWVDDFCHSRHPLIGRYFRYHVTEAGDIYPLGSENRWTYGNTLLVTNPYVDPADTVMVEADFTHGDRWPMTYVGSASWRLTHISTWVGPQTIQVISGEDRVFRTVRWNGEPLHHVTAIRLDPEPPVQALEFTPQHDHTVVQGEDNLTVDIQIGQ